jgi:hypothetical protein
MAGHHGASSLQVREVRSYIQNTRGHRGVFSALRRSSGRGCDRARDVASALHNPRTVIIGGAEKFPGTSSMKVIGAGSFVSERIQVGGEWFNILKWGAAVRHGLELDGEGYLKAFIDSRGKTNLAAFVLARPRLYDIWNYLNDANR